MGIGGPVSEDESDVEEELEEEVVTVQSKSDGKKKGLSKEAGSSSRPRKTGVKRSKGSSSKAPASGSKEASSSSGRKRKPKTDDSSAGQSSRSKKKKPEEVDLVNFADAYLFNEEYRKINEVDVPERMQNFWEKIGGAPDDSDAAEEAQWIYDKLGRDKSEDKENDVQQIGNVLSLLHKERVEVPFIGNYRKEQCQHFIEKDGDEFNSEPKLRQFKDLWAIEQWDKKWLLMEKKKKEVQAALDKQAEKANESEKNILQDLSNHLADARSEQDIRDVDASFGFRFTVEGADAHETFKRPKRRSVHIAQQEAGLQDICKCMGLNSRQFAENLRSSGKKHEVSDGDVYPEKIATPVVGGTRKTPQSVLAAARHIAAVEISMEPSVRAHVRSMYQENATVSTKPTLKGGTVIDLLHPYACVKWLARKPLSKFDDEQWLLIEQAENEGLLVATVDLPEELDEKLKHEFEAAYLSNDESPCSVSWNDQRKKVLQEVLANIVIPAVEKEMKAGLGARARGWVVSKCAEQLWNWASTAPYRKLGTEEDPRIAACCWSKQATVFVMLDSYGELDSDGARPKVLYTSYLSSKAFTEEDRKRQCDSLNRLVEFINDNKPDIFVVGASNPQSRYLYQVVRQVIADASLGIEVVFGNESVAVAYENSQMASEHLSKESVIVRRAIALGRYVQDPLAVLSGLCGPERELMSLKMHPLQHLVTEDELYEALENVMMSVTCQVGVDLNLAAVHGWLWGPLQFVSGFGQRKSLFLQRAIQAAQKLSSRRMLLNCNLVKENVFKNSAAFLRVRRVGQASALEEAMDPLDDTRIHPECYDIASKLAEYALRKEREEGGVDGIVLESAVEYVRAHPDVLAGIDIQEYAAGLELGGNKGVETLQDIKVSLLKGYADIRTNFHTPSDVEALGWLTGDHFIESKFGKPVNVTVQKFFKRGWMCALDSGASGILPKDKVEKKLYEGSSLVCTIQGVNSEFMSLDFDVYTGEYERQDEYYKEDKSYLSDLKEKAQKKIESEKQKLVKSRLIVHPLFKNVSRVEATQELAKKELGEAIVFPSVRGPSFLSLLIKASDAISFHLDILESKKDAKSPEDLLRIGSLLRVQDETFTNLDEISQSFIGPFVENVKRIIEYRKYKTGTVEEIEEWLRSEKSNNPATIPYCLCIFRDRADLSFCYFHTGNPGHEYATISSKGYKFKGRVFDSPEKLISSFQRHLNEAIEASVKQENLGGGRACRYCQQEGHIAKDCPQKSSGGGGGGPRACRTCGDEGHMARECPNKPSGGRACHKCNEEGHIARECPNSASGGAAGGSRTCHICNNEGHIARDCPDKQNRGPRTCRGCGQEGHMIRECPNKNDNGTGGTQQTDWGTNGGNIGWGDSDNTGWGDGGGTGSDNTGWGNDGNNGWGDNDAANDKEAAAPDNGWKENDGWAASDDGWKQNENPDDKVNEWNVDAADKNEAWDNQGGGAVTEWGPANGDERRERRGGNSCFKCGVEGHMSRDCSNKPAKGGCFKCGDDGHMSRDCPNKPSSGGGRACFKCGDEGHMSRDCPNKPAGGTCFNCGQEGHRSRECPSKADKGTGSGDGGTCYMCGECGHFSRECPKRGGSAGRRSSCYTCGQEGHRSRECPNKNDSGNNATSTDGWGVSKDVANNDANAEGWGQMDNNAKDDGWGDAKDTTNEKAVKDDGWGSDWGDIQSKANGKDAIDGFGTTSEQTQAPDNMNNGGFGRQNARCGERRQRGVCYSCGKEGHMSRECPQKPPRRRSYGECTFCNGDGHTRNECPHDNRKRRKIICYTCKQEGHGTRNCPQNQNSMGSVGEAKVEEPSGW